MRKKKKVVRRSVPKKTDYTEDIMVCALLIIVVLLSGCMGWYMRGLSVDHPKPKVIKCRMVEASDYGPYEICEEADHVEWL